MHKTRAEARAFAEELGRELGSAPSRGEIVVAPAFPLLDAARDPREPLVARLPERRRRGRGGLHGRGLGGDGGRRRLPLRDRRALGAAAALRRGRTAARAASSRDAARRVSRPIYCIGETAEERDAGLTATTLVRAGRALSTDPPSRPARRRLRAGLGDRHGADGRGRDCGAACVQRSPSSCPPGRTCGSSTAAR